MLTDTQKECFKQLFSRMLNEALGVDSKSIDEANRFNISFPDPSDRAIAETELTFSIRMKERKGGLVLKIEEAIERIENGTYGICEECEEEISEERLKARPVTTLCIDCKRKQEEHERIREL